LGFLWGKIYIVFILINVFFALASLILNMVNPAEYSMASDPISKTYFILIVLLGSLSGVGLILRNKIGFYATLVAFTLIGTLGIVVLMNINMVGLIQGLVLLGISFIGFIYFWNRRLMFGKHILSKGVNMIKEIGEYRLGQDIKPVRGLVELTPEEYAVLWSHQGGVGLPGEQVFKAPEITYNGYSWYTMLGTVKGRIYKITLQYISSDNVKARSTLEETLKFLKSQMGEPTEQTEVPNRYIWDSTDGNVFLVEREAMGSYSINLLLTSIVGRNMAMKMRHFYKTFR
jgi:hypothetical protein